MHLTGHSLSNSFILSHLIIPITFFLNSLYFIRYMTKGGRKMARLIVDGIQGGQEAIDRILADIDGNTIRH